MYDRFDPAKAEAQFRSALREVAAPLLIVAERDRDQALVKAIHETVEGPLDRVDLVQAAFQTKTFAAGVTDPELRKAIFKSAEVGVYLANSQK